MLSPDRAFFPPGVIRIHMSNGGVNSDVKKEEAAARVAEYNKKHGFIENEFFNPDEPKTLEISKFSDGSAVSVMVPTGPYSPESVMVVAASKNALEDPHSPTDTIYDYSFDTQVAFWSQITSYLQAFHAMEEMYPTLDGVAILGTNNSIKRITDHEYRTSRSIRVPHAQIGRFDYADVKDEPVVLPDEVKQDLKREQKLLQISALGKPFIAEFQEQMPSELQDLIKGVEQRKVAPFGYQFAFKQGLSNEGLALFMNAHHAIKHEFMENWISQLKSDHRPSIKPQPSDREYYFYENGEFHVAVSPEVVSHAGVVEATGVGFSRSQEYPAKKTTEELRLFHQELVAAKKALQ